MNIGTLLAGYTTPEKLVELVDTNDYIYQAIEDEVQEAKEVINSVLSESIKTIQALANGAPFKLVQVIYPHDQDDNRYVFHDGYDCELLIAPGYDARVCAVPEDIADVGSCAYEILGDDGADLEAMLEAGIIEHNDGVYELSRQMAKTYVAKYNAAATIWNMVVNEAHSQYAMFTKYGKDVATEMLKTDNKPYQYIDKF